MELTSPALKGRAKFIQTLRVGQGKGQAPFLTADFSR